MKKITAIIIILAAAFLLMPQFDSGFRFYNSGFFDKFQALFESGFFMDSAAFILAVLLIFYFINIFELIVQYLIEYLIFQKKNRPGSGSHKTKIFENIKSDILHWRTK